MQEEKRFRMFQCRQHTRKWFCRTITRRQSPLPILATLFLGLFLDSPPAVAAPEDNSRLTSRSEDDVIESMLQRGRETAGRFSGYQAVRTFEAENLRFQL